MSANQIIVMAIATPKPEFYQDCLAALLDLQKDTLREPGCMQFDILEHVENDGRIYFYEIFADRASFDLHFTYDYTKAVFAKYEQWLAKDIDITFLKKAA